MKRFQADYEDQYQDVLLKHLKIEENSEIPAQLSETENEKRIIHEYLELCLRKGIQHALNNPLFQQQGHYNICPYYDRSVFSQIGVKEEEISNYLANNLTNYQDLQSYQALQMMALNNQAINPFIPYESQLTLQSRFLPRYVMKKSSDSQSKYKNCYGLVTGRVIKSAKEYLKLASGQGSKLKLGKNSRLFYIQSRLAHIKDKKKFESFLGEYQARSAKLKRNRGKTTIYDYLKKDVTNGVILIDLIKKFLTCDNMDFQNYIVKGVKGKKRIGEVLSDEKNLAYLREAFQEMEMELLRSEECDDI